MSFKGYLLFNCIQKLICISLNENTPQYYFLNILKISLVKVHFLKKDLVGFPFLCHFHLRKKRCGKDILKKKTRQKDAPNYSSIYFSFFLQLSQLWTCGLLLTSYVGVGQCVNKIVYRLQRTSAFKLISAFLDTTSVSVRFVPLLF